LRGRLLEGEEVLPYAGGERDIRHGSNLSGRLSKGVSMSDRTIERPFLASADKMLGKKIRLIDSTAAVYC
jgi:hypothetical protein